MAVKKLCFDAKKYFQEVVNSGMVDGLNKLSTKERQQLEYLLNFSDEWIKSEQDPYKLSFYIGFDASGINFIDEQFLYNNNLYFVSGTHSDDEKKLLIMNSFDSDRRKFERLKNRFSGVFETKLKRPRIPEMIRIEVWRRDQGRCANCGSKDKLEYDHIVPISKGGSNTVRNIELLCEQCNRQKSDKIQ